MTNKEVGSKLYVQYPKPKKKCDHIFRTYYYDPVNGMRYLCTKDQEEEYMNIGLGVYDGIVYLKYCCDCGVKLDTKK